MEQASTIEDSQMSPIPEAQSTTQIQQPAMTGSLYNMFLKNLISNKNGIIHYEREMINRMDYFANRPAQIYDSPRNYHHHPQSSSSARPSTSSCYRRQPPMNHPHHMMTSSTMGMNMGMNMMSPFKSQPTFNGPDFGLTSTGYGYQPQGYRDQRNLYQ